jgi:hypothetical protein
MGPQCNMGCVGDQCDCNNNDGPTYNDCTNVTYLATDGHAVRYETAVTGVYVDPEVGDEDHEPDANQPKDWDSGLVTNANYAGYCE